MQNATQAEIALEDVGGRIEQVEDLHQRCQGQQQAQGLRQQHPTQIRRQWPFHGLWTLRLRCRNELPSMTRSTLATRRVSGLSPGLFRLAPNSQQLRDAHRPRGVQTAKDRKSVVVGQTVTVRINLGGSRTI